jgi:GDSL-like Lipase/Acylhydrolase family
MMERMAHVWRDPRAMSRLGLALVLLAIVLTGYGRRELANLTAEDSARSIRRFLLGPADVEVTAGMPWAHMPAWLPGPAEQWAGGSIHSVAVHLVSPARRPLRLDVQTSRSRPREILDLETPESNLPAHLRIVVNGRSIATFESLGSSHPAEGAEPRAPPHLLVTIPAAAVAGGPATVALVNDGGGGVRLRHLRLVEEVPSFSFSPLRRAGRLPLGSAAFLAAGLAFLLRSRLLRVAVGPGMSSWRPTLGPALGLVLSSLAVALPQIGPGVPHWAWLLLIVSVLPLGRGQPRATAPSRAPATVLARVVGTGLLVVAALAVSIVTGELLLRAAFRDEPWARSVLGTPAPSGSRPPMNSLGFDEREFPLAKSPGVYRIAVVGDSLAVSAPRGQRFDAVITERMNASQARPVHYEAVSFGRAGVDTAEEVQILHEAVWRAAPDFVLLEWYVNDLENGDHGDRPQAASLIPGDAALGQWARRLTERSLFRWMLQEEFTALQERVGLLETYPAYMHRVFADPGGPRWEGAADALRAFVAECRAHRTPLAIALFPHLSAGLLQGTYEFAELHDQVLELCRQEGVACVDLRAAFAGQRDYARLWVDRFDPHPNALAHRLAGERLVEVLGPLWREAGVAAGAPPAPPRLSRGAAPGSGASRSPRS